MLQSTHSRRFALAAALLSAAAAFAIGTPENTSVAPLARQQGGDGVKRAGGLPADARLAADRSSWAEKLRRTPIEVEPGSSLMGSKNWTPPPSEVKTALTVPPFPFQYMGKIVLDGGETTLYLTKGDEIFSVKTGAVITGNYRVEKIEADFIEVTYLPLDKKQNVAFSSILPQARTDRIMTGSRGSASVTLAQVTASRSGDGAPPSRSADTSLSPAPAQASGFAVAPVATPMGQPTTDSIPVSGAGVGQSTTSTTTGSTGGMVILPPSSSQMPMFPPSVSQMPMLPPPVGASMPMIPPSAGATMPIIPASDTLSTAPVPGR